MSNKVSDLPKDSNLTKVKVRLPDNVLKLYKEYGGGEPEMWIAGAMMGDFFLSPNPPGPGERRLYPMPVQVEPTDIIGWEVVEVLP